MKKLTKGDMDELDKIIIRSEELNKKVKIRVPKQGLTKAEKRMAKKLEREGLVGEPVVNEPNVTKSSLASERASGKSPKKTPKYLKLGTLKPNKSGPSDFRKKSAKWRDGDNALYEEDIKKEVSGEDKTYSSYDEYKEETSFLNKLRALTPIQWVSAAMAVVILATSVMTTAVYADYRGEVNKEKAFLELPTFEDTSDEQLAAITEEVVEEVEPIAAEEPEEVSGTVLSLVMSSVEKDLKIKLVDENDTLVKGVSWGVTVTDSNSNESTYEDEDQDGIIHLTDISAGDYSVTVNATDSLSGYTIPSAGQQVSVKAKIEYKVIANIKDEIKSEKEVNAAAEDANGNQAADVETGTALTDTVEWVESTKTESGENYTLSSIDWNVVKSKMTSKRDIKELITDAIRVISENAKKNFGLAVSYVRLVADNEEHTHEYGDPEYASNGDGTHTKTEKCTVEGCTYAVTDTENCEYSDGKCIHCGYEEPKAATISLDKSSLTMTAGDSASTITATTGNGSGDVSWQSSDTSVATVSSGAVTPVAAGSCTITATYSGVSATCAVTVNAKSSGSDTTSSVTLSGTTTVKVGSTAAIKATVTPSTDKIAKWSVSDEGIAVIDSSDTSSCTVKGVAAGTVTLYAQTTTDVSNSIKITVTSSDSYSDDTQLYDSSGNALYVKDGDSYRLAKYKDYKNDNGIQVYKQGKGYIYTGWQTIDDKTYYFKKDNTYVTGDQVIGGVLYHFGSDGTLTKNSGTLGIDVSKYQPSINWSSVAASGISYVIIRCGYRGASTGALIQDPYFTSHIKGAKAAGLKVGVYFFSTALTETEAVEEASMCAALCSGYGVNYPVFIDVESSSRPGYNSLSAAQRTANIKAFCSTIKSAGYTPGVYANKTWFTSYINTSQLSGYKIWLAQYNASGPTYSGRYDLWQYTSKGSVSGISGNVDMNQSYLGY